MTNLSTLKSLQQRMLRTFDRAARFGLVDAKLGHVMWGMGMGMLLSPDVPTTVITAAFVGGFAGMIYCGLAERPDREH